MNANEVPEVVTLNQEWRIGNELHRGGFGAVFAATNAEDIQAVAKFVPKLPGAERELRFDDLEGKPNVIPILDRGESGDHFVLIMPRAEINLRDFVANKGGRLSVGEAIPILVDIAMCLSAIAGHVVHRDLKPANVLLLDGQWCLADFGIARYTDATTAAETRKYAMSQAYAAPEQWQNERATSATDIYAFGVVAYELLCGSPPFGGPNRDDFHDQHIKDIPAPIPGIPAELQALINECLYKEPHARPIPGSLVSRLRAGKMEPTSGAKALQQANTIVVGRRAEAARNMTVAKLDEKRRKQLVQAAEQSLERIVGSIRSAIHGNASAVQENNSKGILTWALNDAAMQIDSLEPTPRYTGEQYPVPAFDIVAHCAVGIAVPQNRHGYKGRGHSLYYCDAQDEGVFRWYETAFTFNPLTPRRSAYEPFGLTPGKDAFGALSPAMDVVQVAWAFTPIDQGDTGEFVERWIEWFGLAAQGQLTSSSHMLGRNPVGSWRIR